MVDYPEIDYHSNGQKEKYDQIPSFCRGYLYTIVDKYNFMHHVKDDTIEHFTDVETSPSIFAVFLDFEKPFRCFGGLLVARVALEATNENVTFQKKDELIIIENLKCEAYPSPRQFWGSFTGVFKKRKCSSDACQLLHWTLVKLISDSGHLEEGFTEENECLNKF